MNSQSDQNNRLQSPRPPGILTVLPETLTYYPYGEKNHVGSRKLLVRKLRDETARQTSADTKKDNDGTTFTEDTANTNQPRGITIEEFGCKTKIIPNKSLNLTNANNIINKQGFTLFFFVDSSNRQSLTAIPVVSKWFNYALSRRVCNGGNVVEGSRVICIPNQQSSHEINLHNSNTDSILQASINASSITSGSSTKGQAVVALLQDTGFYHLPFLHPSRRPLLHLLGATRVPSVIVVSNATGRIVTRYGWEAIEREGGPGGLLERWIDASWVANKRDDLSNEVNCFESEIVNQWNEGKSGLPCWWNFVSFIL